MSTPSENPDSQAPRPPRGWGRGLIFSAIAIVIAVVILLYQKWTQPPVKLDRKSSVTISTPSISSQMAPDANSHSTSKKSNGASETSVELPPGCITAGYTQATFDNAAHPLDPLLDIADLSRQAIEQNVKGYSATMISRVFADEKLQDERQMFCKIRDHRENADGDSIPFSVYTRFIKPESLAGQEVIWVAGQNDGKLIGHLGGIFNVKRGYLDPQGDRAMAGNRYPITEIGVRNLVVKMKEFGLRDREHDECRVKLTRSVRLNDRTCTLITVTHPNHRPHFDFYMARIFIDDQWNFPIGYEGYSWPDFLAKAGKAQIGDELSDLDDVSGSDEQLESDDDAERIKQLPLLEKYYYTDIQLNPGLTDQDFDPTNPEYHFPVW